MNQSNIYKQGEECEKEMVSCEMTFNDIYLSNSNWYFIQNYFTVCFSSNYHLDYEYLYVLYCNFQI